MHAAGRNEEIELRALLRRLRGKRPQREIAAEAGVSVSLYKKLESGRFHGPQLRNLIRVANVLGAKEDDQAALICLARPDLAAMILPSGEGHSDAMSLRVLQKLASGLVQTKDRNEAVRIAAEVLYASLKHQGIVFAFEHRPNGPMRLTVSIGIHGSARFLSAHGVPSHFSLASPVVVEHDDARLIYAPIREHGRLVAILGAGCDRESILGRKLLLFVETVAAILEVRLGATSQGLTARDILLSLAPQRSSERARRRTSG